MVVWGDIILGFKKFVGVKVLYGFVCLVFLFVFDLIILV